MATSYRYRLSRVWYKDAPVLCWIMLNPSTATESVDDPTTKRVVGFSRLWGFGSAVVVNLFALRSATPTALVEHPDPVGADNDASIERCVATADAVVVAWGNHGVTINPATGTQRHHEIAGLLSNVSPRCLGVTVQGQPRHPLYVPTCTVPIVFSGPLNLQRWPTSSSSGR